MGFTYSRPVTGPAELPPSGTAGGVLVGTYPNPSALANNVVGPNQITADAVGASEIVDGTVGASELASNAVSNVKIQDGAVTLAKMAANSVDNSKIVDGSINSLEMGQTNGAAGTGTLPVLPGNTSGTAPLYVVPAGRGGLYLLTFNCNVDQLGAGHRTIYAVVNGSVVGQDGVPAAAEAGIGSDMSIAALELLAAGDVITMNAGLSVSGQAGKNFNYRWSATRLFTTRA